MPQSPLPPPVGAGHSYQCFEICRHHNGKDMETTGCGVRHRNPQAAAKHGRSMFYPYLSSNQPWDQERLEIRDETGKVVLSFMHKIRIGRSSYARWIEAPAAG